MRFDPNNCGGCNVTCPYGVPCSDGNCTVEIVSLPCTNTISDPNNCGRCGNVCEAPANASPTCTNGVCGFVCSPGDRLCNGVCIPAGNCCTAADCPAGPPSATVVCNSGQCSFICPVPVGTDVSPSGPALSTAVADLARLPSADGGTMTLNTGGAPCCINSDCGNNSLLLNATTLNNLCLNGTCTGSVDFFCIAPGGQCRQLGPLCCIGPCIEGFCSSLLQQSDRNLKENVAGVDPASILERVAGLPISSWNYIEQGAGVRHIGPMAQDFAAAFGVGEDDRHINLIDGQGVALAAIKELARRVEEQQRRIDALVAQNAALTTPLQAAAQTCPAAPVK
jgi:hypothetical protein